MATYKRVFLKLSDVPKNINPDILEFYEKDYYCIALRQTTYEKHQNNCVGVLYTNQLHKNEYIEQNRGFILKRVARGFRFYSNPVIRDILKKFVKSNINTYTSTDRKNILDITW